MSPSQPATIGELGERGLVAAVSALLPPGPGVLLGPGDDAALVRFGDGSDRGVLVSTDVAVDGRHFRRDWSGAEDVGHRVAAANLADVAAMGGAPGFLVVALAAPAELETAWALGLVRGLVDEAAVVGASVVGGDVTESDRLTVSVAVLGSAPGPVVRRSGARPGDVVAVAGRLGWAAAGLAVLGRGFRSPRVVVDAHRRPDPPYAEGPRAAAHGATSMIDVSDGLLGDLGHVATASGVGVRLDSAAFDVPEPLRTVGSALGVDPLDLVLTGGDDHALAATFPVGSGVPAGWRTVGAVAEGEGVLVDGAVRAGAGGHRHFG